MRKFFFVLSGLLATSLFSEGSQVFSDDVALSGRPEHPPILSDALGRAKDEARYLLVVVVNKDDATAASKVGRILSDRNVVEWLEHRAILLELNVGDPGVKQFVDQQQIDTLPAILVLSNNGRELGRQTSPTDAARFVTRINAATQSNAIRTKAGVSSWAGEDVIMRLVHRGRALTAEGQHDEALREFTWCLNHRATHSPLFPATHLEELVEGAVELASQYDPAMKMFRLRLSQAERKSLQSARPHVYSLYLVKFGHLAMGREDKVVGHYDRLLKRWPADTHAELFARIIYGELLSARRYKAIAHTVADPAEIDQLLLESRRNHRDISEAQHVVAGHYEVLLGLGRSRDAEVLVEKMVKYDSSAGTYLALAAAALRSGRATDVNISQARKAYRLTKLKRREAVIVLASLLAQRRAYDAEAIQLLKAAQAELTAKDDQAALSECLRAIQLDEISPRLP